MHPVSEVVLCGFVSHLADEGLKHRTIKTYLSGVRYHQSRSGYSDPFQGTLLPRLDYVMKCCLCFFGFLRAGEMTVPGDSEYDPQAHLSLGDIALDDNRRPSLVRVTIKQSKTDPFRKGIDIFVGRTGTDLCPVAALLGYLETRGSAPGPLFVFADGRLLTRQRFVDRVREALRKAGVDHSKYCGHSFRIGAATTAAAKGVEDCIIKTLGRWESLAYLQYIKLPREQLGGYSVLLAS